MASRLDAVDLWAEIVEEEQEQQPSVGVSEPEVAIIYRRKKADVISQNDARRRQSHSSSENQSRKSLVPVKRVSWTRSLSTRGRTSIAATACVDHQPQQRKPRRNAKPPLPKGKAVQPPDYDKERAYFQEVDAFELLEESPSPKKPSTWTMGSEEDNVGIPHLSSVLRKWLISKKLNQTYVFPGSLSKILETPAPSMEPICHFSSSAAKTSGIDNRFSLSSVHERLNPSLNEKSLSSMPVEETCEDIEVAISKLSLSSRDSSLDGYCWTSFSALLTACRQSVPSSLTEMLLNYCDGVNVTKVGEGTYGEAFKVGNNVCKIVPFGGDIRVNGELQKDSFEHLEEVWGSRQDKRSVATWLSIHKYFNANCMSDLSGDWNYTLSGLPFLDAWDFSSLTFHFLLIKLSVSYKKMQHLVAISDRKKAEELLEEVVLTCTLNQLREQKSDVSNACNSFIRTIDLRVCQGCYDSALISAWEDWDVKHGSENDHPKEFPTDQCYVVFVQEHGGQDLESFVLLNFDEARSLLVQVTLALAVAESAYEFEHRDLHWGNILLSRKDSAALQFILEGKKLQVKTFGLVISIIDFTLSRMNTDSAENNIQIGVATGEDILYLDLSLDPELFEGSKGDKQADTYRKMRDVTGECWEGSFPKTNVLWLQYLVDILLLKKTYERSSKDEREMRSLKKRLSSYDSAKECVSDPFFNGLFIYQ